MIKFDLKILNGKKLRVVGWFGSGGGGAQWSEREETAQRAYVCNDNTFSSFLVTLHCNF